MSSSESNIADNSAPPDQETPLRSDNNQSRHSPGLWLLTAAVLATCAGAFVPGQLGEYFQISKEMADIPPDSARSAEAEVAISITRRSNHLLVVSLICGLTGLIFGIATSLMRQKNWLLASGGGLVAGIGLGLLSVMTAGLIDSQMTTTSDSQLSVESQDTQEMVTAAAKQLVFFAALGCSATFSVWLCGAKTAKQQTGFLIAILASAIICVALYQAVLAIGFPTYPFDEFVPSATAVVWTWVAIPHAVFAFAIGRVSKTNN